MSVGRNAKLKAAALLCGVSVLAAWPAAAENLLDAITLAYQTNPELQAQRANQRAIDEEYVQALASFRPTLTLGVQNSYTDPVSFSSPRNASTIGITVSQAIWTGGRLATAVDAAKADILQGRENLRNYESQVLGGVVQSYVDVRRDLEALAINEQNVDILKQQLAQARAQFDVGEITRTDVAQAEARLAASQAQLEAARAQLSVSRAAYAAVVGQAPGELAPEPVLPGVPDAFDGAMEIALADNASLRAAQYGEAATRSRVASARAQYRPSVNLSANYGASIAPTYGIPLRNRDQVQATATLSVPLFNGGLNGSRVRQALERDNAAALGIDSVRRQVLQNVSQAWARVLSTRASLQSNQEQVRADTIAAEGVRQEYQVGLRTTIDVLNAEQELRDAELALVNSRHDNYVATAQLLQAMGRLEARNLTAAVPIYDPKANFDRVKNSGTIFVDRVLEGLDEVLKPSGRHVTEQANAPIDQQLRAKSANNPLPRQP